LFSDVEQKLLSLKENIAKHFELSLLTKSFLEGVEE
jgi:hypothetical protein